MSEIHYPKGIKMPNADPLPKKKTARKKTVLKIAAGNRGMGFEAAINATNLYYRQKNICLITKRPTPIKVLDVDYSSGPHITSAFYETQSTTDYNGVYQGHYIDFEAKETKSKTSFPLANIPIQQIDHLERVIAQGGIAFFLIRFSSLNRIFLLPASFVTAFYREKPRASIPFETIEEQGKEILEGYCPRVDYLPAVLEVFAL